MKNFTKKGILQKTIIAILIVLSFNFIVPTYSSAGIGGVLANPAMDFIAALMDSIQTLMQWAMKGSSEGLSLSDSEIMVDPEYGNKGGSDPTYSVTLDDLDVSGTYKVPVINYTPEEIFSNKVPYLDINFISPKWTSDNGAQGSAAMLKDTISGWYVALRNLAIVGLLCVLVYVGIRIMLSSTAGDKAKYKQMFTDWLIALCLLFFLHYIMSFTLVMVDSVTEALTGFDVSDSSSNVTSSVVISVDGTNYTTNLMGAVRFMIQTKNTTERLAYLIVYCTLIAFTAIFTWHYLKRLLMMAFLTIIAPLVALTYPIDKIGDGKAQAFNMWLKEYVYNAIIQPFHLIIYTIFVGAGIELAKSNLLYSVAAVAFILPAEKFLKKMFGFDKAPLGTMGALTGFALGSKFGGGKSSSGSKSATGKSDKSSEDKPPKYDKKHGTDGIFEEENNKPTNDKTKEKEGEDNKENISETARKAFEEQQKIEEEKKKKQEEAARQAQLEQQQRELEQQQAEMDKQQEEMNREQGKASTGSQEKTRTGVGNGIRNVVNAHGGKKGVAKGAGRKIGGVAKFATKTAFTAAGMALGVGAGLASGQGLTGAIAGATASKKLGSNLGKVVSEAPGNAIRTAKNTVNKARDFGASVKDQWNGNTNAQEKLQANRFMKDEATEQYVRDKLARENGVAPTGEELEKEMESIGKYANEGMTDIEQIYRARKAEKFGVSEEQAAKIALLAQDRKITSDVLGDEKKYKQRQKDFTQEFINKGMSEADAAKRADYILNVMKAQVGQEHNLGKKPATKPATKEQTKTGKKPSKSSGKKNTSKGKKK